tara:strand:- start:64 stop:342 length:279 start_codon:yes stop_codon:yes gene_type:complete
MEQTFFTTGFTNKAIETAILHHTGTELLVSVGCFGNLPLANVGPELRAAALKAGRRKGWVQPVDTGTDNMTERQQELADRADFDEDGECLWG